jgi:hypothetical protein
MLFSFFSFPAASRTLINNLESRKPQRFNGIGQLPVTNQNVIRFERANRKDPDIGLRQRNRYGYQAPYKIQIQRPDNFESSPPATRLCADRRKMLLANNRKFIPGAANRKETFAGSPFWNWSVGGQSANSKSLCQDDQL